MFTVEGFLDGVYYTAIVGGESPELGIVSGSPNIVGYLASRVGEPYAVTPTGPAGQLDVSSPVSVFSALKAWTSVTAAEGAVPRIMQPFDPGAVY